MKQLRYQLRYVLPLWLVSILFGWWPDNRYSIRIRGLLVSAILPGRPKGLTIGRDVTLLNIDRLEVGNKVYLAKGVWLNAVGGITIGDEVIFSPYVVISSSKHCFKEGSVARGGSFTAPIEIGFGTWVSSNSTIAAGVSIGRGCLIGANTLVSKSVPDNMVALGVPAEVVKARVDRPGAILSAR